MKELITRQIEPLLNGMQLMIVDGFQDIFDIEVPTGRCYATIDSIRKTESHRKQIVIELTVGAVALDFFNEKLDLLSAFMYLPDSDKEIIRQRERKLTVMATSCRLLADIKEEMIDRPANRIHLSINGNSSQIGE